MNEVLWQPDQAIIDDARVTQYLRWLEQTEQRTFADYAALWRWSIDEPENFWRSIWTYFDVTSTTPFTKVLADASMPGARWFEGATVNYAAEVFKRRSESRPAIVFQGETTELVEISWAELEAQVAALAASLRAEGVQPGDRVVAYLPNIPEAVVALLACASVGAVWSVCAPDFGVKAVLDRFQQIEPKLLIAADGYTYNGKFRDRAGETEALVAGLPSLQAVILLRSGGQAIDVAIDTLDWRDIVQRDAELETIPVDFAHPLWILYSSGTTGTPKAIVHGHGGVIVEHLKSLYIHLDLTADDRFFWFSSTAWMMWNYQVSGLLLGTTIVLYDGNPTWPTTDRLWMFAEAAGISFFGGGAAFFDVCRNKSISPRRHYDLAKLRAIGSTGSPLLPESFQWIYREVASNIYVVPISGGTDIVSAFVGGVPTLPVRSGEMSCRCLGAAVAAFDEAGDSIVGAVGELVCTQPMPSMPLCFWGDTDNTRYLDSYFDVWPGVWRHGDWIEITPTGAAIIYGRSDATINRGGIRMGTSELYSAVEALPEVTDSLVVDLEFLGRDSYLPLFVVLQENATLDDALIERIRSTIRENLSPRHVPNDVFRIAEVPRTFSGKKLEIPIRKLLLGQSAGQVINKDTMANPTSADYFIEFAKSLER